MSNEYFPHDYGARLSLRGVRKDFGLEGLGFYWCFVEILHEEGGYVKETDIENIAYDLQIKPEICEGVIRNYDLFTIKKGKIWSERVLKNIKKRADISAARKNAADARWKSGEFEPPQEQQGSDTPPRRREQVAKEEQPAIDTDEQEWLKNQVAWFRNIIKERCQEWADEETDAFAILSNPCFNVEQLLNNIIDEIADKKTLKINNRYIDTVKFLESLVSFFRNEDTRQELYNAIIEVEEKCNKGEIKNKQNYLISTLYNKVQMSFGG